MSRAAAPSRSPVEARLARIERILARAIGTAGLPEWLSLRSICRAFDVSPRTWRRTARLDPDLRASMRYFRSSAGRGVKRWPRAVVVAWWERTSVA